MEVDEPKKRLWGTKGEIALHGAVILIVAVILLAAALEVNHIYASIDLAKDKTDAAVLAVAASNVSYVFSGVREGESIARYYDGNVWERVVTTSAVVTALKQSLGAELTGTGLNKPGSFQLSNISTRYDNADGGKLNFTTTMTIKIPLSLGGGILPAITADVEVHTAYEPKF